MSSRVFDASLKTSDNKNIVNFCIGTKTGIGNWPGSNTITVGRN